MNLIKLSIERPIAVISAVLMVVMFGLVALQSIPIQLAPDVNRPVITVRTFWPGAAPAEIERNIINRQEDVLKGLEGLDTITSRSRQSSGSITLEFKVGTNMDRALLLVSNRLDQVTGYPDEADEPSLDTAGSEDTPIAWFIITREEGNERPIHEYGDFLDDVVKERIERVPGISQVNIFGEATQEIDIVVEPELLARYGMTVSEVVTALRRANASVSAGDVDEGKRRYVVRTEGELDTVDKINDVVIRSDTSQESGRLARVTVGDIAEVRFGHSEPAASIRMLGQQAVALNAVRETGANVIETMRGVREAIEELQRTVIPESGLKLRQVYDETVYIDSSIELVQQNIWVGGALAALILLIFLRSPRATLVISVAIPVSVIGSFVAMAALGRSINVISLAGLAFAVGMVVDAAIVVLENIYRKREAGKPTAIAAYEGAQQVWGAILVSALTTVMVFIPILVMQLEVGQLFRDIAVAISVSVLLSLIVSITVLPALANRLLGGPKHQKEPDVRRIPLPGIDHFAAGFVAAVIGFTRTVVRSPSIAFLVVATVTAGASFGAWKFLPKLEYLPEGNRNLVFGIIIPPPGYNLDTTTGIAKNIEDATRPHWAIESGEESGPDEPPKMERFFFVARSASTFLGAVAVDPSRAKDLIPLLEGPVFREPGTFGFINQPSIFGRGIGGGRKIELDISGPDLEQILAVAQRATTKMLTVLPPAENNQFRPNPGLELGAPEVRVIPDRVRLADNGVTARELGDAVDTFNDGLRVAEITVGNKRVDMMLQGPEENVTETQGIGNLPVVTSSGQIIPVTSLAEVILTSGPTEIRHRENFRTVTLELRPSRDVPLETALDLIQTEVIDAVMAEGVPAGIRMGMSGTADKLSETWQAMILDLALALAIVYLVMAVLFESFLYPLIILLSVPVAAAGGVGGLAVLNLYGANQSLDMLTLLGFVILIGIVVNNAILLVHQTLYHIREEDLLPHDAIIEATRNRIRPIFMSTLTSVVGMLPLVIFPGAGSELYRGLGSVVVGGLSLSAVLTLLLIPPMLAILVGPIERARRNRLPKAAMAPGE
ncbi:efflux RND transporter permease subunit [Denitrobaculum tricleocarpae]|uniref:Efflux RND transporter permease subunit n=1 Tax=Denitrobaculum tricleocarpae TaxID=2591009 RepID=A0A545TXM2_9PROT|nr:efflux RND transporter permease subunit [Denitrobaculum tricleocarpae]TQV81978.1 efflux RND transporter permease subunit [Denitrobaculum tricleocarpae]